MSGSADHITIDDLVEKTKRTAWRGPSIFEVHRKAAQTIVHETPKDKGTLSFVMSSWRYRSLESSADVAASSEGGLRPSTSVMDLLAKSPARPSSPSLSGSTKGLSSPGSNVALNARPSASGTLRAPTSSLSGSGGLTLASPMRISGSGDFVTKRGRTDSQLEGGLLSSKRDDKERIEGEEIFMHPIFLESRLLSGKTFTNAERKGDVVHDPTVRKTYAKASVKDFDYVEFTLQNFTVLDKIRSREEVIAERREHSETKLSEPLLRLKASLHPMALAANETILWYSKERDASNRASVVAGYKALQMLVEPALSHAALRDELFCQLVRHLTGNRSKESIQRTWHMLLVCCACFAPTPALLPYLLSLLYQEKVRIKAKQVKRSSGGNVKDAALAEEEGDAKNPAHTALTQLMLTLAAPPRHLPPSFMELVALEALIHVVVKYYDPDACLIANEYLPKAPLLAADYPEKSMHLHIDSHTYGQDLLTLVARNLGLKDASLFDIFEVDASNSQLSRCVAKEQSLMDVLAKWEFHVNEGDDKSTLSAFKLVLRARLYVGRYASFAELGLPADPVRDRLVHLQHLHNVASGLWSLKDDELVTFLALTLQEAALRKKRELDKLWANVAKAIPAQHLLERSEDEWRGRVLSRHSDWSLSSLGSSAEALSAMLTKLVMKTVFYGANRFEVQHESGYPVDLYVNNAGVRVAQAADVLLYFTYREIVGWSYTSDEFTLTIKNAAKSRSRSIVLYTAQGDDIARLIDAEVQRNFRTPVPYIISKAIADHPLKQSEGPDDAELSFKALKFTSEETVGILTPLELIDVPKSYEYLRKHNPRVWGLEWSFVDDSFASSQGAQGSGSASVSGGAVSGASVSGMSGGVSLSSGSPVASLSTATTAVSSSASMTMMSPSSSGRDDEEPLPSWLLYARRIFLWLDTPQAGEVKLSQSFATTGAPDVQVVQLTTLAELSDWLAKYGAECKTRLRVLNTWHKADDLEYAASKQLIETLRRSKHWYPVPILIYSERKVTGNEFITYDFPGVTVTSDPTALMLLANPHAPIMYDVKPNDISNPAFRVLLCRLNGKLGYVRRDALVEKEKAQLATVTAADALAGRLVDSSLRLDMKNLTRQELDLDGDEDDVLVLRGGQDLFSARTLQDEYELLEYEELRRNKGHQWFDMRKRLAFDYKLKYPLVLLDYVTDSEQRNFTASEIFKRILQYMGDSDEEAPLPPYVLAQRIVRTGIEYEDWRDEIYLQLCKQTSFHPNPLHEVSGWHLFLFCAVCFPPSPGLYPFLLSYVQRRYLDLTSLDGEELRRAVHEAKRNLQHTMGTYRQCEPSKEEMLALTHHETIKCECFYGGRSKSENVLIDSRCTVLQLLKRLLKRLDLEEPEAYRLFEFVEDEERELQPLELVCDILTLTEFRRQKSREVTNLEEIEGGGREIPSGLLLKRAYAVEPTRPPRRNNDIQLLFSQTVDDISFGRLAVPTDLSVVSLAAHLLQAIFGDYRADSPALHENNYENYVPSSWVKKKPRETWIRSILDAYAGLVATSAVEAMRKFIEEAQKLPHFGYACFNAESKRDKVPVFLLVGLLGVFVIDREKGAQLSHYSLSSLITWRHEPSTAKITLYFGARQSPIKRKFLLKMNAELSQYLARFLDMVKEAELKKKLLERKATRHRHQDSTQKDVEDKKEHKSGETTHKDKTKKDKDMVQKSDKGTGKGQGKGKGKDKVSPIDPDEIRIDLTKLDEAAATGDRSTAAAAGAGAANATGSGGGVGGNKLLPTFSARTSAINLTQRRRGTSISAHNNLRQANVTQKEPESLGASMRQSWANM